ncbi:four helix bundle protein [Adhaeribacter arboris]|uniref:Four helix bundle protein n=1 Tax=Adhaeribacter arboris TaxID=2072846 RepID=A0A2T2YHC3_9BACT|nr:four helix bundle protein [Adhaeribacter arboris]PSR54909.1 four helix bundle protein [Adhaeribacter arboris]
MKSYTELEVWQKSRKLAGLIYRLTATFPKEEIFALTSQLRRSAVSIPSNIAEGCGRSSAKDSIQFFYIARGSLYELETQLFISFDLNYVDENTLNESLALVTECKKLLHGFIKYFISLKV